MMAPEDRFLRCDLSSKLQGVKVVASGIDNIRGHDPAHEEDGPCKPPRKNRLKSPDIQDHMRTSHDTHLSSGL